MQSAVEGLKSLESVKNNKARTQAPVFVLGCPRSGTTVLYHMLLSAGDFAVYRTESNVFNLLVPHFGDLRSASNRKNLMQHWLRSKMFRVSGLKAEEIEAKIMAECRSGGDFLRIVMEEMARQQGVNRWAESTPDHLLHIPEIIEQVPDALVIHIIRDGRDVALSYVKQRWVHPFPWDSHQKLAVAGLYWEWVVRQGREHGEKLGPRYQEVRFEDLVTSPAATLDKLSGFVGHDLDYERIRQSGIGSVSEPNSSFSETGSDSFNPVGRWKARMSKEELALFERLVGGFLRELGYGLEQENPGRSFQAARLRATYLPSFKTKQWLKTRTPLGRRVRLGPLEIH
jgi:Sulfotransferase family